VALGFTAGDAAIVELVATFLLCLTVLNTATTAAGKAGLASSAGILIGLALAVGIFVAGPISGASINPAATFGLCLAAEGLGRVELWTHYLPAQLIGAIAAPLVFMVLHLDALEELCTLPLMKAKRTAASN